MVDLSKYGSISHMYVELRPEDAEEMRSDDVSKWSKGAQLLYAVLERADVKFPNRRREVNVPGSRVGRVITIIPVSPNRLLVLFQTMDQMDADLERERSEMATIVAEEFAR